MENLLQNKLFLQYLSGAGGAMSAGDPVGPALNQITQQNIGAQSKAKLNKRYIEMMRQILEGGGDIKLGKDTTDVKIPSSMYGGLGSELAKPGEDSVANIAEGLRAEAPQPGPQFGQMSTDRASYLNPSASPLDDLSGADLAGLTAADVSQALSGAVGVQALKQKTLTDISDAAYKKGMLEETRKRTGIYGRPAIPKDTRTTAVKNFEYAQSVKGGAFKGSFGEWEKEAKTTHQKEYAQAVEEGYKGNFHEWLRDMTALSGGLSLGEKVKEKEALISTSQKAKLNDPDYVADIEARIQKAKSSNPKRMAAATRAKELQEKRGMSPEAARDRAYKEWVLDVIDMEVRGIFKEKEVEVRRDGWYVDGKIVRDNPYAK